MPKSRVRKKRPQQRPAADRAGWDAGTNASWRRSPNRAADFDPWMIDTWTPRWTLLVTFILVCTTVILAMVLSAEQRDLHSFETAPMCGPGQTVGCQLRIPVTIQDRGQSGTSKNPSYYLDVSGAAPADGQIDLASQDALWNSATAGDSATAVVWNGAVVRIDDNGVVGDTSQAPYVRTLLVGGFLLAAAVWALVSALYTTRVVQTNRSDENGWTRHLVPLEIPALIAAICFPIGAMIGTQMESFTVSVASGAGLTAIACIFLLFRQLADR